MVKHTFDRGDIVRVCLNPVVGKEMQGDLRPCLVLSPKEFNRLGVAFVAPITQGGNFARVQGFAVSLIGAGIVTQGVVLVSAMRSLDLQARQAKFVEKVPDFIIEEVLARLQAVLDF